MRLKLILHDIKNQLGYFSNHKRLSLGLLVVIASLAYLSVFRPFPFLVKKPILGNNEVAKANGVPTPIIVDNSLEIKKDYSFPISTGSTIKLDWTFDSADLKDEVVIKGQKASAVSGKTFLIINFKIKSTEKQEIPINTRDFIRLSPNNNGEWIAPDIHNDQVVIQPISTKYTRVGFPVDKSTKSFKLQVGGLADEKSFFDINFP